MGQYLPRRRHFTSDRTRKIEIFRCRKFRLYFLTPIDMNRSSSSATVWRDLQLSRVFVNCRENGTWALSFSLHNLLLYLGQWGRGALWLFRGLSWELSQNLMEHIYIICRVDSKLHFKYISSIKIQQIIPPEAAKRVLCASLTCLVLA